MGDLFNISRQPNRNLRDADDAGGGGAGGGGNGGDSGKVGVFITPQSLATFPVASTAVTIVWNVLGVVNRGWAGSRIVPLVIALVIGMLIYLMSADKGQTTPQKIGGFAIALLNSFTLAAAALGLDSAAGATAGGNTPTP